jgi:hypothetical protein
MHVEDTHRCHANGKKAMHMDGKIYKSVIYKFNN